ncbi:transglutaminase [Desulfosarcina ovata subsp. sediminis]|uniref:Transglutaminase n=1 Tax=Desulfosarcina ovata subsp. sediminis TaxID=885957 RepID=A0A5K7ZYP4_9BACT|nr:DUF3488 and transglutaminase-like domain-containing protein [Desulfosarcina ovata]BBO85266.1 transglutaminase [Desulfosarcina ovata subsp. sediminis]
MLRQPIRALIVALAAAAAPLVFELPWWAVGWCLACWGYCLAGDRHGWSAPPRWIRTGIFVTGSVAVLVSAGLRFDGRDFITLLAVMAGMKPLEIRNRRDSMVTVFLAYFLVITSLFVFENLSMTVYLFLSVWITTAVLIQVNHPKGRLGAQLRLAGRLVVVAIPLTVLLFFLFPRLSGSYWGSPWTRQGRSGFTGTIRIGDVSRLALVDAPAFSVFFDGAPPPPDQRYWRGIVFQRLAGRTWYPEPRPHRRRRSIAGETQTGYTVVLESTGQRHLFVLDLPLVADPVGSIMDDHTLLARRPVRQRLRYHAVSVLDYRQSADGPPGERYRQLPGGQNPRSTELGRRWAKKLGSPAAVVAAGMDFFRESGFAYSLQPGPLGPEAVDGFLFSVRKGFCEHYASAFTVLMRAADIPTRMVGGYQGGRWNALGGFLSVRQSHAHVWCEVWLGGQGWTRVDPTQAVAPERIDGQMAGDKLTGGEGRGMAALRRWHQTVQQTWETLNMRWNMWFMGFSAEDQVALLKRMGIYVAGRAHWFVFMALPVLFIGLFLMVGRLRPPPARSPDDAAVKIYGRFLDKMRRIGLPRPSHLGPRAYSDFVGRRHPALKAQVDAITQTYIALRYRPHAGPATLQNFGRQVRRFKPLPPAAKEDPGT